MKLYIAVENLKQVLKAVEGKRDEDLKVHPDNKPIWEWITNNIKKRIPNVYKK